MTSTEERKKRAARGRGSVRKHHAGYEVRVSAGIDPVTGRRMTLQGTAPTARAAEKLRTKLLAEADAFKSARTNASLGRLLDRWLPQHDVDENTRESYESLIRVHIRPGLGDVPLTTLARRSTELVEQFYGELRQCRERCGGRTLIDHKVGGEHDCQSAGCRPHVCRPLDPATVCRIHAVRSAACSSALRWGWIPFNPIDAVRAPSKPRPSPRPPTPAETAQLVEEATRQHPEWGLYLWLAVVTGARRGEMVACGGTTSTSPPASWRFAGAGWSTRAMPDATGSASPTRRPSSRRPGVTLYRRSGRRWVGGEGADALG